MASIYGIEADETTSLREAMPSGPVSETVKLRQVEEKNIIDTTTVVTFQQTAYGLPVWNSNLSVVVAGEPPRGRQLPAARSTTTSTSAPCPSTASPASRR